MKMSVVLSVAVVGVSSVSRLHMPMAFVATARRTAIARGARLFSTSSDHVVDLSSGVSRLDTLQTLLLQHGAPGSKGCTKPNDLQPIKSVPQKFSDVGTINQSGATQNDAHDDEDDASQYLKLHPHLLPIAKSTATGNVICALRRVYADDKTSLYESSAQAPWPIVESKMNGPGMKLLALSSEHLMRRIVCECDLQGTNDELIKNYNQGLGQGKLGEPGLDTPYEPGSVEKLGYGVDKYVLLRVGPFADIYESLAMAHKDNGDQASSLITAESANGKISGFASTFLFYARILVSFPNREEEARDAARVCLRMPLPSIGMDEDDFKEVAILGQIATSDDDIPTVMEKLQQMQDKIRTHEQDDPQAGQGKTPETEAIDEANSLLDSTALDTKRDWQAIRPKLAEIYSSVGRDDMAAFVNPQVTSKFA